MQAPPNEAKWIKGVCGGAAAMTAEVVTLPVDVLKVRLQLSGEGGQGKMYNGVVDAFQKILKQEGLGGLFKGLTPGLLRQAVYQGWKMNFYEPMRNAITRYRGPNASSGVIDKIAAGGIGGATGAMIANPFDLIKVRMQADRLGTRYRNTAHALSDIFKREGLFAFWKGTMPNLQRAFIVNAAEMATYDTVKSLFMENGIFGNTLSNHMTSSFISGFVAAVCSTPVDLTKTRLMNQPFGPDGKGTLYKGMLDCFAKTAKLEGLLGLYKGFIPMWFRLGPWNMAFFITFEQYRRLCWKWTGAEDPSSSQKP